MRFFRRQQLRIGRPANLVLVAAQLSFVFALSFTAHIHVLANGRVLVHSHALPFSGENTAQRHSHSALEMLFYELIAHTAVVFAPGAAILFTLLTAALLMQPISAAERAFSFFSFRRAPPQITA